MKKFENPLGLFRLIEKKIEKLRFVLTSNRELILLVGTCTFGTLHSGAEYADKVLYPGIGLCNWGKLRVELRCARVCFWWGL